MVSSRLVVAGALVALVLTFAALLVLPDPASPLRADPAPLERSTALEPRVRTTDELAAVEGVAVRRDVAVERRLVRIEFDSGTVVPGPVEIYDPRGDRFDEYVSLTRPELSRVIEHDTPVDLGPGLLDAPFVGVKADTQVIDVVPISGDSRIVLPSRTTVRFSLGGEVPGTFSIVVGNLLQRGVSLASPHLLEATDLSSAYCYRSSAESMSLAHAILDLGSTGAEIRLPAGTYSIRCKNAPPGWWIDRSAFDVPAGSGAMNIHLRATRERMVVLEVEPDGDGPNQEVRPLEVRMRVWTGSGSGEFALPLGELGRTSCATVARELVPPADAYQLMISWSDGTLQRSDRVASWNQLPIRIEYAAGR